MVRAYEQSMTGFAGTAGTTAFNATSNVLAGVVFPKLSKEKLPASIEYSLRFPAYQRTEFDLFSERFTFKPAWFTESIYPLFRLPGPRSRNPTGGFPGYFAEGFLYLQNAIESSITKSLLNPSQLKEYNEYNIKLQRFPYPTYTNDNFIFARVQAKGVHENDGPP
ncbi:unnamed protein product [Allacma fusca]|uniref:Uncharacterized protein n=1 Tax=Allacma fusca TaxID=39272 RepID=A0A8J2PD68_9HEXA|nr:unnamed protein product [Allacma fusca]